MASILQAFCLLFGCPSLYPSRTMYVTQQHKSTPKVIYPWGCTSVVVAQAYAGDFAYGTKD